jgi:chromate reductase
VEIFEGAGELPPFNPDLDREGDVPPPAVAAFRALLGDADAFVISSPEYAHGVPGAFKNALDWIVSSGEFGGKPVAIVSASVGGQYARRALIDTLTVMGANVLTEASPLALTGPKVIDADGSVSDPGVLRKLEVSLTALVAAAAARAADE